MKKTLVTLLALVFVLSIASAAFAAPANPFVDVPAKHWAYAAVSQLAAAGIVDGYGDGTFKGDKTITRYEMAQMVAKAMAKSDKADAEQKALIDKLAVEFAAELNNLGVRVAKLEAGASSIKFSGDFRFRYINQGDKIGDGNGGAIDKLQTRLRLSMAAQVNDNTSFHGSLIAQNNTNGVEDETTNTALNIESAYFTTKDLAGMDVSVGRQGITLGQGYIMDAPGFDGITATFGKDLKVMLGYGDIGFAPALTEGDNFGPNDSQMVKVANLSYSVNPSFKVTAGFMYAANQNFGSGDFWYGYPGSSTPAEYQAFGFNWKMNSDWSMQGEFGKNAAVDFFNKGWYTQVNYKGAGSEVGSYGISVGYEQAGINAINSAITTLDLENAGEKSWYTYVSYTPAKNVTTILEYQTRKAFDCFTAPNGTSLADRYRLYLMYRF